MAWMAALPYILSAAGTAASLYGANKQSQDTAAALAQNQANTAQEQKIKWAEYLMSRGINPVGGTINTKLPFWANVSVDANGKIIGMAPKSYTAAHTPTLASLGYYDEAPHKETDKGGIFTQIGALPFRALGKKAEQIQTNIGKNVGFGL